MTLGKTQSLDTNKQFLVSLGSSEHWLWWEGKTFLALRALALEDWGKFGLGIVMRSTPAWPQPYTHSSEYVRNVTVHLMVGSLDCPRGGEEDLSTAAPVLLGDLLLLVLAVVGRLSGSSSEWHSQSLGQGEDVVEDARPARVNLRGTSMSLLKMAKSEHFQMFHSPDYLPQTCALKSLDWWREIARLLDLFLVGLFLIPGVWKCFT